MQNSQLAEIWFLKTISIYSTFVKELRELPSTHVLLNYLKIKPSDIGLLRSPPEQLKGEHLVNYFNSYNLVYFGKTKCEEVIEVLENSFIQTNFEKYGKILPPVNLTFKIDKTPQIYTTSSLITKCLNDFITKTNTPHESSSFFIKPIVSYSSNINHKVYLDSIVSANKPFNELITIEDIYNNIQPPVLREPLTENLRLNCKPLDLYYSLYDPEPNIITNKLIGCPGLYVMGDDPKKVTDRFY